MNISLQKTRVPCVQRISANTFRIGVMITVTQPDGTRKRKWIRQTHRYDDTLTEDQQLDLAAEDLADLKHRLGHDEGQGHAIPAVSPEQINTAAMTVAKLCALWCQIVLPGQSEEYARAARSMIDRHIKPHIGPVPLEDLSPLRISIWVSTLQSKLSDRTGNHLSDKTIRHCYITMATICNWAVTMQLIDDSPFRKTKPPKVRKHKPKFLTDEEAVQLLRQLADEPITFRCSVLLALTCGLRLGQVSALTWSDINFTNGTIDISKAAHAGSAGRTVGLPKTDDSIRLITAPAGMLALLHEARADQQERQTILGDRYHDNHLIICSWDGSPICKDTPSKQWSRFAKRAGYDGITFHNLRTSHATILMANGVDAVAIASRLGHSDATTTLKYYTMVIGSRDQAAAIAMDTIFTKASTPDGSTQLPPSATTT